MARSSQASVQKRQRERKKAEQAELKREQKRRNAEEGRPAGGHVADANELAGYGIVPTFASTGDE
jgi:hypothetical protein